MEISNSIQNPYTFKSSDSGFMWLYSKNFYRILPHSTRIVFDHSHGVVPGRLPKHVVHNVGRSEVHAETIYGTAFGWIGVVSGETVKPKETKTLNNSTRAFYRSGLQITNDTDIPAIICAEYADGTFEEHKSGLNLDYNALLKKLVVFGVKFVPYVGPTVSGLLNAFWPESKPNVWEDIKDRVQTLLDNSVRDAVNAILSGDIRHYQERIKVLDTQLNIQRSISSYYMNLAQDLVGFELKFTYPEDKYTAFVLLPMYSAVVMMKMNYYAIGICKADELGLSDEDVRDIKTFAQKLIEDKDGVTTYINRMYKEKADDIYNTAEVRDIYNSMMNTRSFIAVNGLEYIPLWKQMLVDPSSIENAYVDALIYSEFFGRTTADLDIQATPEYLTDPLTPKLIDGRRNKMTAVKLYIWRTHYASDAPKIGGIETFFENGESYKMGGESYESEYIDFKGAHLTKLYVGGEGALDVFTFYFFDGRQETYGKFQSGLQNVFELKDHHIASIYLSNDVVGLRGQAANVVVSYLQD